MGFERTRRLATTVAVAGSLALAASCSAGDASDVASTVEVVASEALGPGSVVPSVDPVDDPDAPPTDSTPDSVPPLDTLPPMAVGVAPTVPPAELAQGDPAEVLIEPYILVTSEVLGVEDPSDLARVSAVVQGHALDTLQIALDEFADNGWTQVGNPVVASSEVLSIDAAGDPPTAVVLACLDSSGVDIVDADGVSVVDEAATRRALNEFILQFLDDRWAVTDQTFPVETAC